MRANVHLVVVASLALVACSTASQALETLELQKELQSRYVDTDVQLAWVNGLHHLEVTLDGPSFRVLPDSLIRDQAVEVARVVLAYFPEVRRPDSITVSLVRERSGGPVFLKRTVSLTLTLAATEVQ